MAQQYTNPETCTNSGLVLTCTSFRNKTQTDSLRLSPAFGCVVVIVHTLHFEEALLKCVLLCEGRNNRSLCSRSSASIRGRKKKKKKPCQINALRIINLKENLLEFTPAMVSVCIHVEMFLVWLFLAISS